MNTINCNGKNIFIVNKKPQFFQTVDITSNALTLKGEVSLNNGELSLDSTIYACLFCDKLKNITFIIKSPTPFTANIIFAEEDSYKKVLDTLQAAAPTLLFSPQNEKINGYASGITEKLIEGIEIKIIDAQKEDNIIYCPSCGTQCDPNIPYCMECGASI